jgi:hypothetical protein
VSTGDVPVSAVQSLAETLRSPITVFVVESRAEENVDMHEDGQTEAPAVDVFWRLECWKTDISFCLLKCLAMKMSEGVEV